MDLSYLELYYFEWICDLVCDKRHKVIFYQKFLKHLHSIEFFYILEMDENSAIHGEELRRRFGYDNGIPQKDIKEQLCNKPCSVLEMMVALALICEERIMDDPEIGNRTSEWFWGMVDNLGLGGMTYSKYDGAYIDEVITRLLNREYEPNGEGGLFTLHNCEHDLRTVDIWYQMMWWLNENYDFTI